MGSTGEISLEQEMDGSETTRLRVLVADGRPERLEQVTRTVASLGHEVITRQSELREIGPVTSVEQPDLAVVIVGESSDDALQMIGRIVHEASCPVIAVLDVQDPAFVNQAARRGIFAYISGGEDPAEFQSSIDITLQRFAEYQNLEGAFGRRAVTERAKGILMARRNLPEAEAFRLLQRQSQDRRMPMAKLAESIVQADELLESPHSAPEPIRRGSSGCLPEE